MALSSRVAQFYGYAVCLVAVVTFLIAASNFVDAAFDRSNPLLATSARVYSDRPLTSFEAYRAGHGPERPMPTMTGAPGAAPDTLSTAEQRARYEALRTDRIMRVGFESMQRLVKHGLLVLLSLALFAWHWRWLRERERLPDAG